MRKSHVILRLTALAIVVAFGFGMVKLWMLRYDTGDIYEPYSSLRTDPLGARAFYESLGRLPGVSARRNYRPLKYLTRKDGDTLFYLGLDDSWMPSEVRTATSQPAEDGKSAARAIHEFAASGGRVVISFTPSAGVESFNAMEELFGDMYKDDAEDEDRDKDDQDDDTEEEEEEDTTTKPADSDDNSETDNTPDEDNEFDTSSDYAMGVSIGGRDDDDWRELHKTPAMGVDEVSINWPDIPWRGSLYFKGLSDNWKVICQQNDEPVIIEGSVGSGSIVICADSYFLSNEAVVNQTTRNPQLLAWLAGGRTVIFDEIHLGQANRESLSSLARQHGLTHLFFVLLVLGGLYIWKNSVSFLPRDPEHTERFGGGDIQGKSSALGLQSLLRKCIPPKRLLGECLKHWSTSTLAKRPKQRADEEKIRALVAAETSRPAKNQDPVKAYTTICRILSERKE